MKNQKKNNQIENLKQIKEIISISKFDTLQKLKKIKKISENYLESAFIAKEALTFAGVRTNPNIKNKKKLWIFLTPEKEILSYNVMKFSKLIYKINEKKDYLVCLGHYSSKFVKKRNIKTIYLNEKIKNIENKISFLLTKLIISGEIYEISFISDSSRSSNGIIDVFPIEKLNIKYKRKSFLVNENKVFYPSISECVNSLTKKYISRITFSLISEFKFFYLKEKLIKNESSIKNIDKLLEIKRREMNKENRKKITEDLIFMSQFSGSKKND